MAIDVSRLGARAAAVSLAALLAGACGGGSNGAPSTPGSAGTQGGGGAGQGGAGTGAAGTGGAGAGGTVADAGVDGGDAAIETGGTPDAGGGDAPAARPFTCPAGPFEAPKAGAAQTICPGFKVRYGWNEGPTWNPKAKAFFYSNFVINASGPGDMIKFDPATNTCEFFLENVGCNGLGLGTNGNIIATCHTPRAVMEYDPITKEAKKLADMAEGKMLDSPNDLIAHSNGTIYFSNPTFELGGRPQGLGNALVKIAPGGAVSVLQRGGINGIALSPDEKRLYVVGMGVWDVDAAGNLSNNRNFSLGGDGIAVDCAGNVYDNGGNIRNPAGQTIGNFPGGTNMAFGGEDGKTLLVVANQSQRIVPMNLPGLP